MLAGAAGANVVHVTGRDGSRRLAPSRYRLVVSAGQATGAVGFRITR